MNAVDASPCAASRLAGLTQSPGFRLLFGIASVLVIPVLVLGGVFSAYTMAAAVSTGAWTLPVILTLPSIAGIAGMLGLLLSSGRMTGASAGRIELIRLLLGTGLVGAFGISACVVSAVLAEPEWSFGEAAITLIVVAPLLVLSIEGFDRLSRLNAVAAATPGASPDALPLVFLVIALTLVGSVALIMAEL